MLYVSISYIDPLFAWNLKILEVCVLTLLLVMTEVLDRVHHLRLVRWRTLPRLNSDCCPYSIMRLLYSWTLSLFHFCFADFICDICKKTFKRKAMLEQHISVHQNKFDRETLCCPYDCCPRWVWLASCIDGVTYIRYGRTRFPPLHLPSSEALLTF
jgi:hypothetical protein